MSERRGSRRLRLNMVVDEVTQGHFTQSHVLNLSKGGMFIEAEVYPPIGTNVDLELTLPLTQKHLRLKAVVVWAADAQVHPAGVGISFLHPKAETMDLIEREIELLLDDLAKQEA